MRVKTAVAAAASKSKRLAKKQCEDAVGKFTNYGVTSMVLCDGAGSKRYSATGARTTVNFVGKLLTTSFDTFVQKIQNGQSRDVSEEIIQGVRAQLSKKRYAQIAGINEYASTLLLVATDKKNLIIGQLGDGGIVISNSANHLAFDLINGEFVNQTSFTTSSTAVTDFQLKTLPVNEIKGVTMFSDGTASSIVANKTNNIATAVSTMVGWLSANKVKTVEAALLDNLNNRFVERTHDDCSICVMSLSDSIT